MKSSTLDTPARRCSSPVPVHETPTSTGVVEPSLEGGDRSTLWDKERTRT